MYRIATVAIVCALGACSAEEAASPAPTATADAPAVPPITAPATAGASAASVRANVAPPATATPNTVPVANNVPLANSVPPAGTPAVQAPTPAATTPITSPAAASGKKLAMDECGLHTKYPGDEYCILPPPADKGFQLHIGPSNYESPEAKYVLQPGEENVVNMTAVSGNDKDVQYYYRQYRMRPGSHHVILTADGKRIGGTQNLARDNPDYGVIPPENADIGLPLPAHAQVNANMHFYNVSDKPMLRELWVNYWYKDPATVKQTAKGVFSMTGVTAAVAHSHVVVGASCPVTGSGHVLTLQGHRHLNNVRFSIWHTTGAQRTLVFEDYDSEHPASLEYNSLVTNPLPDPLGKVAGGTSGILNLQQGDKLDFECEIVNMTNKNFFGANEASDDEMCILTGDTVGASVAAGCTTIAARKITAN